MGLCRLCACNIMMQVRGLGMWPGSDAGVLSPQIAAYNSGYGPQRGPKTYGLGHWAVVREAQRLVQWTLHPIDLLVAVVTVFLRRLPLHEQVF